MNKRKIFWILGFLFLISVIILSLANRVEQKKGQAQFGGQPQSEQPLASPGDGEGPSTIPDPAGGENQGHGPNLSKSNSMDAVNSAVEAVQALSVAQLLPAVLLAESVNNLAVPESRSVLIELLGPNGRNLATAWGYDSIQDALNNSEYRVATKKYRVGAFDPAAGTAVVSLYTVTHFVTKRTVNSQNQITCCGYNHPRIKVVSMRWVEDRWLYVASSDPAPGQAPVFTGKGPGLSYDQVVNLYKPFLEKGRYIDYG